jgi:cytochrome c553
MAPRTRGRERGFRIMRYVRLKAAILAVACSAVATLAGHAESLAVRNCNWCHGGSGRGYTPAPQLAGQRPQYIEKQLVNFSGHTRDNPFSKMYMWRAAANLSRQTAHELAMYYATLSPRAANDGDRALIATGQSIYQEGQPDSNIVACVVCHGPNAEGVRGIPRLGGLAYPYLKQRLEQWGEGYHAAAGPPMPDIAGKLSRNQIDALASYLSFLK